MEGLISGSSFKDFFPEAKFVKLIEANRLENCHPLFENNINEIQITITTYHYSGDSFASGGIKFGDLDGFTEYFNRCYYFAQYICKVEIPDDAQVYIDKQGNFLTNKIFLNKFENFEQFENKLFDRDENYRITVLYKCPQILERVDNVSEKDLVLLLGKNPHALTYIKNPTEEMFLVTIRQLPYFIRNIKNPSLDVVLEAIKYNPYIIKSLDNISYEVLLQAAAICPEIIENPEYQSEELYKTALEKNGEVLNLVPIPYKTKELCMIAFNNTPKAFAHIPHHHKTKKMCKTAVKFDPFLLDFVPDVYFSNKVCRLALERNGLALRCIKGQTEEMCFTALKQNKNAIFHAEKPTDEMYLMVLDEFPHLKDKIKNIDLFSSYDYFKHSLKYDPERFSELQDPTYEQCLECLKITSKIFKLIPEKFKEIEELCMVALGDNPLLLKDMHKQTENMSMVAVIKDPEAIVFVENQTFDICKSVLEVKGDCIRHIHAPTDQLRMIALQQDIDSYKFMSGTRLSHDILLYVAQKRPTYIIEFIDDPYLSIVDTDLEKVVIEAITQDPKLIQQIPYHQTDKICKAAINKDPESFVHIQYKTDELIKLALSKNGLLLKHVNPQTYEHCEIAIKNNAMSLESVIDQTDELCMLAINLNYKALGCIREQTFEHCLTAVSKHFYAMKLIKDQTEVMCKSCTCINPRCANFITDFDIRKECQRLVKVIDDLL